MAKVLVANMLIMHDRERIEIDAPVDPKKFTEAQLLRLYERGAVRVVDASEVSKKKEEESQALKDLLAGTKTEEEAAAEKEAKRNEQLAKDAEKATADAAAKQKALDDAKAKATTPTSGAIKKP